jgi:energy-converting hydrogenase Eha subunit A
MAAEDQFERLRRHSRWLARLTMALLTACALVILVPTLLGLASLAQGERLAPRVALALVFWSPSLFYLFALAAIARAFGSFARGGVFGPAMARGCRSAGTALALGATMSALGVPNLLRLLAEAGFVVPPRTGYGTVLIFDTAYLAVGVVGIALFLLGGLIDRAAELQREAGALRAELGEFF